MFTIAGGILLAIFALAVLAGVLRLIGNLMAAADARESRQKLRREERRRELAAKIARGERMTWIQRFDYVHPNLKIWALLILCYLLAIWIDDHRRQG
jgi:hypothetical protein